jgi:hypothetical protein
MATPTGKRMIRRGGRRFADKIMRHAKVMAQQG